jgi:hypothetical protein
MPLAASTEMLAGETGQDRISKGPGKVGIGEGGQLQVEAGERRAP